MSTNTKNTVRVTLLKGTASKCMFCRLSAIVRVTVGMQRTNMCHYHTTTQPEPIREAINSKLTAYELRTTLETNFVSALDQASGKSSLQDSNM